MNREIRNYLHCIISQGSSEGTAFRGDPHNVLVHHRETSPQIEAIAGGKYSLCKVITQIHDIMGEFASYSVFSFRAPI